MNKNRIIIYGRIFAEREDLLLGSQQHMHMNGMK